MIDARSVKKKRMRFSAVSGVKIFAYRATFKKIALNVLTLMRTWQALGLGSINSDQREVLSGPRSNFLAISVGSALNVGWSSLNKLNYSDYIKSTEFQLNAKKNVRKLRRQVHLSFFKNLNELILIRWGARFLFSADLLKSVQWFFIFKKYFSFVVAFFCIVLLILLAVGCVVFYNTVSSLTVMDLPHIFSGLLLNNRLVIVCSDSWYFCNFFLEYFIQCLSDLACPAVISSSGEFHLTRWSLKALFVDWEILYSYTELLNSWGFWIINLNNRGFFAVLVPLLIILLYILALVLNAGASRNDFWNFFFNFSYFLTTSHRLQSLEFLNQLVHGNLMKVVKNKKLMLDSIFFSTAEREHGEVKPINMFCLEYCYAQTIGGVVGFVDLFPTYATYHNSTFNLRVKLKTFNFFNRIRNELAYKLKLMGVVGAHDLGKLVLKKSTELKYFSVRLPKGSSMPTFLSPRFYLEHSLAFFFKYFDWLFVVSCLGDYGVFKMRNYFFQKAIASRDPWDFFDNDGGRSRDRVYRSITPQKINWYGRELNSVVASQTIMPQFRSKSLFRFKFNRRNLVNDFSFWKPEINSTGRQTYFSHWDLFSVENQFDINLLGATKFGAFDQLVLDDEEDESQLEYVVEDAEIYFEDGLLHKDFELIFFDHELEDVIVRGQLDPLFIELGESPKLKALLNNESLIYRAGQEGDHLEKTVSQHYSNAYSLEYGGLGSYKSRIFDSFYDDLSDFLTISGRSVFPVVTGVPRDRSFLYWGGGDFNIYGNLEKSERMRLGRLFYSYWAETIMFLTPEYFRAWNSTVLVTWLSAFSWGSILVLGNIWFFSSFLPDLYFIFDILFLLCVLAWLLVFISFVFLILTTKLLIPNVFYAARFDSFFSNSLLLAFSIFLSFLNQSCEGEKLRFKPAWILLEECWNIRGLGFSGNKHLAYYWHYKLKVSGGFQDFSSDESSRLLNFFFLSYQPFSNFSWFYGISDYKLCRKMLGFGVPHVTNSVPEIFLNYGPVTWQSRVDIGVRSLFSGSPPFAQSSRAALLYFSFAYVSFRDTCSTDQLPVTVFYDFQVMLNSGGGCGTSNFLFGMLLTDNLRVLTKLKLVGGLNSVSWSEAILADNPQYATLLRAFRGLNTLSSTSAWSTTLVDIMFSSLQPQYKLLSGNEFNTLKNKNNNLNQVNDSRAGLMRGFGSRKRSSHLHFFENRVANFSYSIYLTAYENFLRLFFSKEALREVYHLRAGRFIESGGSWSYTNKIKFTNFATPLQGEVYIKKTIKLF